MKKDNPGPKYLMGDNSLREIIHIHLKLPAQRYIEFRIV